MVIHLPNLGSQCQEPCENYKIQSDVLETPVILMPDFHQGAHQGGHATARFLEGFLEGSLKEVPS